jgi:hypothetical protein
MAAVQQETKRWWQSKRLWIESEYITHFWDWFITFLGKSAEIILFATMLYDGYLVMPGVPKPADNVDAAITLVQWAALDIGGYSLIKMSKKLGLARDSFPCIVGYVLVSLMVINMILVPIQNKLPANILTGVQITLLIARAVMAVIYGHAIRALKEELKEIEDRPFVEKLEAFSGALQKIETESSQRIASITESLQHFMDFQKQQNLLFTERIESASLGFQNSITERIEGVDASFQQYLTERLSTFTETLRAHADSLSVLPTIEANTRFQLREVHEELAQLKTSMNQQPKTTERLSAIVSQPSSTMPKVERKSEVKAPAPIAAKKTESPLKVDFDKKQFVFNCLTEDRNMTISVIQQRAAELKQTISVGTVSGYRKEYLESHPVFEIESENGPETPGEIESVKVS